jgi:DNA-binding transcriptional regulator YiaG
MRDGNQAGTAVDHGAAPHGSLSTETSTRARTTGLAWAPDEWAARRVSSLGNKVVAQLLNVSQGQLRRWRTGAEVPSPT